jgi:uncharacterized membrane protein YccC
MPRIIEVLPDLRRLVAGLATDFRTWLRQGPRTIDEIESVASVLLAIVFAHLLDARNIGWAAFSGYMVMRAQFSESFMRGCLRIVGTALGAIAAWSLATYVVGSPLYLCLALGLVGWGTLYMALIGKRSYAWLFTGLTFAMVLIDGMAFPHASLEGFAQSRFVEVFTGTCAAVLVSGVSAVTVRRRLRVPQAQRAAQAAARHLPIWHREAFLHALQGAIALALIPWVWTAFHIEGLSQSSTTIMAVMMVPLASLSVSSRAPSSRLLHRFIGCTVGGLLATGILLLAHPWPWLMVLAMCVGVAAGRHVENGKLGIGYIGTQFVLAFLVVLVPDSYASADIGPGVDRLIGILVGMLLLEPVRLAFRRGSSWRRA